MASMDSHVKKSVDIQSDISKGVETINGEKFRPCKIKVLEIKDRKTKLEVQITEGKNREISFWRGHVTNPESPFFIDYTANVPSAKEIADEIIKNTYRTLMTRGMKGCYVYCTDKNLQEYLKNNSKVI